MTLILLYFETVLIMWGSHKFLIHFSIFFQQFSAEILKVETDSVDWWGVLLSTLTILSFVGPGDGSRWLFPMNHLAAPDQAKKKKNSPMSKSFIVLSGFLLVILLVCYFRCYCNYLQATKIVLFLLLYCLLKVFPQSLILASNSPGVPALFWHVSREALGTAIFSSSSQIFLDFLFLVEFVLLCLPVWCGIVALKANTVTWNFLQVEILNTPFLSDTTVGPSPLSSTEAWVSE